jgi:hypothetical protein
MQDNSVIKERSRGVLIHPAGIYYNRVTGHQWARRDGCPAVVDARSTQPHPFLLRLLDVEEPSYNGPTLRPEPDITPEEVQLIKDALGRMALWSLLWMQSFDVSKNLLYETLLKAVFDRRRELAASEAQHQVKKRAPRKWERDRVIRMQCVEMARSQWELTMRLDWNSLWELGKHTYPTTSDRNGRKCFQNYVSKKLRDMFGIRVSDRKKLSPDES